MKPVRQQPNHNEVGDDSTPVGGVFYRCEDLTACGLRFPVAASDPFYGRCPSCGGRVQVVANVEAATHEAFTPFVAPPHSTSNLYLLLDNWRSLFNVGAVFRTADGAGVRHLYLCGITATPDSQQKLAKTALGAEQAVTWSYHADAIGLVAEMRAAGAQLWVLERSIKACTLFDINLLPSGCPIILAAGNEVLGVDPGLLALADRVIQLPMFGVKESLNVAVALSVATYWLRAQELSD